MVVSLLRICWWPPPAEGRYGRVGLELVRLLAYDERSFTYRDSTIGSPSPSSLNAGERRLMSARLRATGVLFVRHLLSHLFVPLY